MEEANKACFIVRDSTGQALGYFYFEDEPGRRSVAKLLTKDEARRMAPNFAKLAKAPCHKKETPSSLPAWGLARCCLNLGLPGGRGVGGWGCRRRPNAEKIRAQKSLR
jgi:hypothetical protein